MIILGDYSVLCWQLYQRFLDISKQVGLNTDLCAQLGKLMWARHLNQGPVCIASPYLEYRLILAMDTKFEDGGYWRTKEIWNDQEIQNVLADYGKVGKYKGDRKPKSDQFLKLYEMGINYANIAGFTQLGEVGFEADDFAGLACRRFKHLKNTGKIGWDEQLVLWTVDRDWSQLVDDHYKIIFANTRRPKETEVCQKQLVCNSEVARHTYWKYGYEINHPTELLEVKVENGDWGDNLPPGECSRIYMDLLSPCPIDRYNLDKSFHEQVLIMDEELLGDNNLQLKHLADAVEMLEHGRFKHLFSY